MKLFYRGGGKGESCTNRKNKYKDGKIIRDGKEITI
jgi:hypothetical protein